MTTGKQDTTEVSIFITMQQNFVGHWTITLVKVPQNTVYAQYLIKWLFVMRVIYFA